MEDVKAKITAPALLAKEATIPVIIEVKGRRYDDPLRTMRALVKAERQLLRQAGFLFSDFKSLREVIAIAGAGIYWRWMRIARTSALPRGRSSDDSEEYTWQGHPSSDSGYSTSNAGLDVNPLPDQTNPFPADRTPFTIGTEESRLEVLKLKTMVREMAERELGVATGHDTEGPVENNTVDYRGILRALGENGGLPSWDEVDEVEGNEQEADQDEEDEEDGQDEEGGGSGDGYVDMDEDTSSGMSG